MGAVALGAGVAVILVPKVVDYCQLGCFADADERSTAKVIRDLENSIARFKQMTPEQQDADRQQSAERREAAERRQQPALDQSHLQQEKQEAALNYKQEMLKDALAKYEFVLKHGHNADICIQASAVAYDYLQLEQADGYEKFTNTARIFCRG